AVGSAEDILVRKEFADLPASQPPATLSPQDLEKLWRDLQGPTGIDQVIWQLVACPERSVPFLVERLRQIKGPEVDQIPRLLGELDNDRFAIRRNASEQLELLGAVAETALVRTLQQHPSQEVARRIERLL